MAWTVVKGFPDYEISTEGVVRNIVTKKVASTHSDILGYQRVRLSYEDGTKCNRTIGKLMLDSFIHSDINYNKFKVHYKDGDKSNVRLSNLCLRGKRIREKTTGLIFDSISECAAHFGISEVTLYRVIKLERPDKNGHWYENVEYFWPTF